MGIIQREIREAEGCEPIIENADCLHRGDRDCHHCYTCRALADTPPAVTRLLAITEAAEAETEVEGVWRVGLPIAEQTAYRIALDAAREARRKAVRGEGE